MKLAVPNLPYYVEKIRRMLPEARIETFDEIAPQFGEGGIQAEAIVLSAERGSAWTLLHPEFTVVVPQPGFLKVPLAYPLARRDERFRSFLDEWLELKRKDGTLDALYRYWILGQNAEPKRPRWSVVRDVLHWVD